MPWLLGPFQNTGLGPHMHIWKGCGHMEDCLFEEMEEARKQGQDVTAYLARMERCCWDHDVASCEVCRSDGLLPAQECVIKVYNLGVRS
jgi:hypothetical protein